MPASIVGRLVGQDATGFVAVSNHSLFLPATDFSLNLLSTPLSQISKFHTMVFFGNFEYNNAYL